jgi:hypothetical protein
LNSLDLASRTPFQIACETFVNNNECNYAIIQLLLNQTNEFNIHALDSEGNTVLHLICYNVYRSHEQTLLVLQKLLQQQPSILINQNNLHGGTALGIIKARMAQSDTAVLGFVKIAELLERHHCQQRWKGYSYTWEEMKRHRKI